MKRRSCQILPSTENSKKNLDLHKDLNHPAFVSIKLIKVSHFFISDHK